MNAQLPKGQLPKGQLPIPWKLVFGLWPLVSWPLVSWPLVLWALVLCGACAASPPLRVCADPNNLPFSNERGEGFENKLAEMVAAETGAKVEYTWWAQRRGFVRNTLRAGDCDVLMGVPTEYELAQTTRPYYRSSYVFVSRKDRSLHLRSLDDERLKNLRIGVQMIGDDFSNSPPAHALSARGIVRNVVGYSVLGDYSQPNPPARIVDAVASGDIDAALVWGPLAGYFAQREGVPLELATITPQADSPSRPFVFDISMAVRRGDTERLERLENFIERRRADIDRLLDEFGVPRVAAPEEAAVR
jgi:mxaJ protein